MSDATNITAHTIPAALDCPEITPLPPSIDLETPEILKAVIAAKTPLLELKGCASALPNQGILIDTLWLTESGVSSEIENIVTTQDELFQTELFDSEKQSTTQKEVARYRETMRHGYDKLKPRDAKPPYLLTNNLIIEMYQTLQQNAGGFRTNPGTVLKNHRTNAIVYRPPESHDTIVKYMTALEAFINEDEAGSLDPLIKMALIHHQFESIHPFADGNGRLGRILNILYLVKSGLLDVPVLYLSGYINQTRDDYYRLLQKVRTDNSWTEWVLYMLRGVKHTATSTLRLVYDLRRLMGEYKQIMRSEHASFYSQDLINHIFRHPYTRIDFLAQELKISRPTSTKYLNSLCESGLLEKQKSGRSHYYVNAPLLASFRALNDPIKDTD